MPINIPLILVISIPILCVLCGIINWLAQGPTLMEIRLTEQEVGDAVTLWLEQKHGLKATWKEINILDVDNDGETVENAVVQLKIEPHERA